MNKSGIIKDIDGNEITYSKTNNVKYENIVLQSKDWINRGTIDFSKANFSDTNLESVSFNAGISGAIIKFEDYNFTKANMINSSLSGSNFSRSKFINAILIKSKMHAKTNLINCNFDYADLRGSVWKFAGAGESDLGGASFNYADIRNVNFENSKGFSNDTNFENALVDRGTIFPTSSSRPTSQAIQKSIYILNDKFVREFN